MKNSCFYFENNFIRFKVLIWLIFLYLTEMIDTGYGNSYSSVFPQTRNPNLTAEKYQTNPNGGAESWPALLKTVKESLRSKKV